MIIYGKQPVLHLLEKSPKLKKKILLAKQVDKELFKKFKQFPIELVDFKKAQALAKNGNHQGFFVKIEFSPKEWEIIGNKILILDNVTDMGNIGAITRTAFALGIDLLIITGIKELKWPQLIRTSAGAAIDMKILTFHNILELLNILKTKNYTLIGADLNGECKIEQKEKIALIMGNEGEGLNKRVKSKLDKILTIKMKNFNSLNVSVAAGILIDRIANEC